MAFWALALIPSTPVALPALASPIAQADIAARLKRAYPDYVSGIADNAVEFKDGTRLIFDDGETKSLEAWLARPDIEDMFLYPYPAGAEAAQPSVNFDPGRARSEAFFTKIYGDCRQPGFANSLTTIAWLPKKSGQRITISRRNGVADHLQAVSEELDRLPAKFDRYLLPPAGGFVCRSIAGTNQRSGHGYGIAIDIATRHAQYWRWRQGGAYGPPVYRNEIPREIVGIFEKHGFIWGGRWYHYDTMHFEYRPELLSTGE